MHIKIQKVTPSNYPAITNVIQAAFANDPHGDQTEHLLVKRLRDSKAYIPELSLVAEAEGKIVGHIILSKIKVKNENEVFDSLALAPVSVHPDFQGNGIGGKLILEAHKRAKELGYCSIILLGHENYYPRFGYKTLNTFGIKLPFDVPDENCMGIELIENALEKVNGTVEYPKAFFG